MNNPFDYIPDEPCREGFRNLLQWIAHLQDSSSPKDMNLCRELAEGKMLGVLVATDGEGNTHTLYAFSGQLAEYGFHYPGFVGPVFDYLRPDGYFKLEDAKIVEQTGKIARYEEEELLQARMAYKECKDRLEEELKAFREQCRESKRMRDARRDSGVADQAECEALIRQSQFEKAELRRLKQRQRLQIEPLIHGLQEVEKHLEAMKEKRRAASERLQQWLFDNVILLNAKGEKRSLAELFADTATGIPPSGAGECCAPKLLQEAYRRGWTPHSMAEYWYGKPKGGEVRIHGRSYPACRGKCLPLLPWMLEGLEVDPPIEGMEEGEGGTPEILYENEWFCVVNKPSGMLSVPGKGQRSSVQQWLQEKYGDRLSVKVAHRLDQDTSGLLVAAFGEAAYKTLQTLFARREMRKSYVALLEGDYRQKGVPPQGIVNLPIAPDIMDRPRQRIDFENGKESVTEYEFVGVEEGRSRILFHPLTGRTHQLRIHAAAAEGLGMPIVGDRLYCRREGRAGERLMLHAWTLSFTFPLDGRDYSFELPAPF